MPRLFWGLTALVALVTLIGCGGPATLPTATTPEPTPDIQGTVEAAIQATMEALPTETPVPTATPNIDATIDAAIEATTHALPTATVIPTPTPRPTPTPTTVPTPTPTTVPTPTPRPTVTPIPIATPTVGPTPTPAPLFSQREVEGYVFSSIVGCHLTQYSSLANVLTKERWKTRYLGDGEWLVLAEYPQLDPQGLLRSKYGKIPSLIAGTWKFNERTGVVSPFDATANIPDCIG